MKKLVVLVAVAPVAIALSLTACSNTKPEPPSTGGALTYRELMLKDYDDMQAMVRKHLVQAHKTVVNADNNPDWEHDAKAELLAAEKLIMSRPDSDNMVAKLVPEVRHEIAAFGSYDEILETMTTQGIEAFRSDIEMPAAQRATYLFILENLMAEMQPEVAADPRQRACIEHIRDAKISVPHDVMAERKLQGMFLTTSPSDEATRILDEAGFGKKKKH